jgi:cytochrome c biogenesis protein CcmG/thiol:disulfide interchange protein DsbE
VGKPAPQFRLPTLATPDAYVSAADLRGKVWILNVWASWCVACRLEHPVLVDFAKTSAVPVYGLNYKDTRAQALRWLGNFGDPYRQSLSDTDGLVGIDFGVYGVPETFVIDRNGVIQLKLTGPITPESLRDTILPLIGKLGA